jgi:hypothetical protein
MVCHIPSRDAASHMIARSILSNGRTVKENGGGIVCINFFGPITFSETFCILSYIFRWEDSVLFLISCWPTLCSIRCTWTRYVSRFVTAHDVIWFRQSTGKCWLGGWLIDYLSTLSMLSMLTILNWRVICRKGNERFAGLKVNCDDINQDTQSCYFRFITLITRLYQMYNFSPSALCLLLAFY